MSLFDDDATGPPAGPSDAAASWDEVRDEADGCRACPLWEPATQTVFGEGPVPAAVMLVGEQPGDQEDQRGRPFVGPAGAVLDRALAELDVDRGGLYVTNAVKHFKFEQRGKRRIHQTPDAGEVRACHPWLDSELALVRPRLVVLLGATAAKALLGSGFRVTKQHGVPVPSPHAELVTATVHPSSILRGPPERRQPAYDGMVDDLRASFALLG
ncbi:MAG TPA: UdgX family uracil-DNA binding protein [Aquihabitans sp.]|jgi:DNA polymerase|nr:UdgX family uracil-DNA binding protein [Aquihabitans sp.]